MPSLRPSPLSRKATEEEQAAVVQLLDSPGWQVFSAAVQELEDKEDRLLRQHKEFADVRKSQGILEGLSQLQKIPNIILGRKT